MKFWKALTATALGAAMLCSVGFIGNAVDTTEVGASYDVAIAENNNLATNKWDWDTDKVGSAETYITEDGLRMENFNKGGSAYAVYQTNRFTEFKYSMYANINLTRPSEYGYTYDHDYSNLYISFMINADTLTPAMTCPWNFNKAYFSVCFENLQGSSKTQLYINESYVGNGAQRYVVAQTDSINWNDGDFHWYEFEFRKATVSGKAGMQFVLWYDGVETLTYFQANDEAPHTQSGVKGTTSVAFDQTTGYLGYWTSSDFPVGADTVETNCYVEIAEAQITSYDGGNTTPYAQAPAPEFNVETKNYSPAASYDTGEEVEIKLTDLFEYEGDQALTYEFTCNDEAIGTIRNGYWVWTPTTPGTFDVDVTATTFDNKTAVNYLTFRVVGDPIVSDEPTDTPDDNTGNTDDSSGGGCGSSIAGAAGLSLVALAGVCLLKKRRGE